MVKIFFNRNQNHFNPDKNAVSKKETDNKNFYIYIEYLQTPIGDNTKKAANMISFSAIQNADFSGHGFLEIIHPALALHQIRCSRNQIDFGIVFELEPDFDIDSPFIPDYNMIVWKKNYKKFDQETLTQRIAACQPHKVRIGNDP